EVVVILGLSGGRLLVLRLGLGPGCLLRRLALGLLLLSLGLRVVGDDRLHVVLVEGPAGTRLVDEDALLHQVAQGGAQVLLLDVLAGALLQDADEVGDGSAGGLLGGLGGLGGLRHGNHSLVGVCSRSVLNTYDYTQDRPACQRERAKSSAIGSFCQVTAGWPVGSCRQRIV